MHRWVPLGWEFGGSGCGPSLQVRPHTGGTEASWRKGHSLGLLRQTPRGMFQGGYIPLHLRKLPPGSSALSNRTEEKVSKRKETGIASDSESCAWGGRALPFCTHSALGTTAPSWPGLERSGPRRGRRGLGSWGRVAPEIAELACTIQMEGGHAEATRSWQSYTDQRRKWPLHGLHAPCSHEPAS